MTTINKASSTIPFYFSIFLVLLQPITFILKWEILSLRYIAPNKKIFFHKNQFPYASDIIFVVLVLFFMCCQH